MTLGGGTSCAILSNGTVKCWDYGNYGQNGITSDQTSPVLVSGIADADKISLGDLHSCAIISDGTIKCWGYGAHGQLGDGSSSSTPQTTPVTVSDITNANKIYCADAYSCAILSDGSMKCWGRGNEGQMGNGSSSSQSTPVSPTGL